MTDASGKEQTALIARDEKGARPLEVLLRPAGAGARPPILRLRTGRCVVGTGDDCDLLLSDPTVSRAHAEFQLVPEGVAVTDLGSRNGTFYLGQRIQKAVLSPGATVELGNTRVAIETDAKALGAEAPYDAGEYAGVIGASASMRRLFGALKKLEGSLVPVLIEGESGTGKEVVARALHERSRVAKGPLVSVNCGALPRELVASELFGHKRGAFTGAVASRVGAFDEADGGTLFLDEIGELPLELQPTLLRALEIGEIRTLGDDRPHRVTVRLVAATNRDLSEAIAGGTFREDLYYRLAVVRLMLPPLRERREDIAPLARHFVERAGLAPLPDEIVEALKARPYPGNVRELRNVVQAFDALGVLPEPSRRAGATLDLALSEFVDTSRPYAEMKEALTDRFTEHYLRSLMARTAGNQSAAARIAGLDRTHLGRLLAKHRKHK